ncbi:MAG: hypothetical protein KKA67_06910 [Spirochaetes bacterium]|nr:hypothetical protein [Spirochaetota bacterium]MBU1081937.1 hypothetical protein [Spirochaetota bacterium]
MNYSEFHDHKWARNVELALGYWKRGEYEKLYRGDQVAERDYFPGLRVMGAYWASVEHEMPLRLSTFLRGAGHPDWLDGQSLSGDPEVARKATEYFGRFLADMAELAGRMGEGVGPLVARLSAASIGMPDDWASTMSGLQRRGEAAVAAGDFPRGLLDEWLAICLRSVADYNRYLVAGATAAAAVLKRDGPVALRAAVDATSEDFMWDVSRAFFATALPKAGFEDIGDLMELGLRGMYADQYFHSEPEVQDGEATLRTSVLENCELAGVYAAVEAWEGLPPRSLGYAFCRYCEAHGLATMMITMPPMVSPGYRLLRSLGLHGEPCRFELRTSPADDMPRILAVQERVFGAAD